MRRITKLFLALPLVAGTLLATVPAAQAYPGGYGWGGGGPHWGGPPPRGPWGGGPGYYHNHGGH
ncbi:MAG: hypothetical protein ABF450_11010, partial [Acetobacter orientalis]